MAWRYGLQRDVRGKVWSWFTGIDGASLGHDAGRRPAELPLLAGWDAVAVAMAFAELEFRDSLTEMDSRFRGNDGQTATASVKVTCLAEVTSFPRKRESIA